MPLCLGAVVGCREFITLTFANETFHSSSSLFAVIPSKNISTILLSVHAVITNSSTIFLVDCELNKIESIILKTMAEISHFGLSLRLKVAAIEKIN